MQEALKALNTIYQVMQQSDPKSVLPLLRWGRILVKPVVGRTSEGCLTLEAAALNSANVGGVVLGGKGGGGEGGKGGKGVELWWGGPERNALRWRLLRSTLQTQVVWCWGLKEGEEKGGKGGEGGGLWCDGPPETWMARCGGQVGEQGGEGVELW